MHYSTLLDMIFSWIPFVLPFFQCVDVFNWSLQMYPIIGDRYRCVDCEESIGFDLCGDCYKNRSKRPGRFNQKHTPDHKLELVQYRRMLISRGQDSSDLIVIPDDPASSTDEDENQSDSDTTNWKLKSQNPIIFCEISVQLSCESSNPHGLSAYLDLCILVLFSIATESVAWL